MKAEVTLYAILFFTSALILHVVVWRIRRPQPPWFPLLGILLATPLGLIIIMQVLDIVGLKPEWALNLTPIEWLAAYVLHCALAGGYFLIFPIFEVGSPMFRLMLLLKSSMPKGMSMAEIEQAISSQDDLTPRLEDLLQMGLVAESDHKLVITPAGKGFLRPFLLLRYLLGLPPGEG